MNIVGLKTTMGVPLASLSAADVLLSDGNTIFSTNIIELTAIVEQTSS